MFNKWYRELLAHGDRMTGDQSFIQFTVDSSGIEIDNDTPQSDSYFDAPWANASGSMPETYMEKYISSWQVIYHPDLIERNRDN